MSRRLTAFGLSAALALSAAVGPATAADTLPAFPIQFGGPFELVDHNGQPRSDADFRGAFMLIYFGYTYCPDICPTNLDTMSRALDLLDGEADGVQPIFVSVDPARDTVAVMKDYVSYFHPDMIGLTGSEQQIRAVAKAYRIHRAKVPLPDAEADDEYLVTHSPTTFLMGPDGAFVTLFPHDTTADFMAGAIRKYLRGADG